MEDNKKELLELKLVCASAGHSCPECKVRFKMGSHIDDDGIDYAESICPNCGAIKRDVIDELKNMLNEIEDED